MPVLVIVIVLTNIKRIGNPIMNLDSLNSACTSYNSICSLPTSFLASLNWSSNIFFSSLHTTLVHFGGWCCLGCFPPKCGWARVLVEWALFVGGFGPKISDMTNSSCWERMVESLSFCADYTLLSFFVLLPCASAVGYRYLLTFLP